MTLVGLLDPVGVLGVLEPGSVVWLLQPVARVGGSRGFRQKYLAGIGVIDE